MSKFKVGDYIIRFQGQDLPQSNMFVGKVYTFKGYNAIRGHESLHVEECGNKKHHFTAENFKLANSYIIRERLKIK